MEELHHISDSDLNRYHFDTIRGPELAMIEEHLRWCLHCAGREEISCAESGWKGTAEMEHVSTEDLERFHLGRVSDPQAVVSIEHHISECRECADRGLDRAVH